MAMPEADKRDVLTLQDRVVESVKRGGKLQVVEQGGVLTAQISAEDGSLLNVVSLSVPDGSMKNFAGDLMQALSAVGYRDEDILAIFKAIYTSMAENAGQIIKGKREKSNLALTLGREPQPDRQGYIGEGGPSSITGIVNFMQRAGISLFSPEAVRTAREMVNEDLETMLLNAQARNDRAKMRFLATQTASAYQTFGKLGLNATWVELYEKQAAVNNWPAVDTVDGILMLLDQVIKPVVTGLLALPQIASELADLEVEEKLAGPRHEMELKVLGLNQILKEAKARAAGKVQVAIVEAGASVARVKAENAEVFIEAARQKGYQSGAQIGAVATAAGETLGNAAASTTALVFRPLDAIKRWAEAQQDPRMVTFVLGGFLIGIPVAIAGAPVAIVLGPIAGGMVRTMWKSFRS